MEEMRNYESIREHLRNFFTDHSCEEHFWNVGPTWKLSPNFRVAEFSPGPRCENWVYVSIGSWEGQAENLLEFMIVAPHRDVRHVELLTMTAWYHRTENLGLGHTFPIGQPWLDGSRCEFMLVSLPYPFGPELEICPISEGHLHLYWLLPITEAERAFKIRKGLEALERRFEECELEYWNPDRDSSV